MRIDARSQSELRALLDVDDDEYDGVPLSRTANLGRDGSSGSCTGALSAVGLWGDQPREE